jgi:hypothetical protein
LEALTRVSDLRHDHDEHPTDAHRAGHVTITSRGIRFMRLRAIAATIITTVAAATLSIVVASPASAAAPVVVSPANGGTLPTGSTGPLVIDFPATGGSYSVSVKCGSGDYYWSTGGLKSYAGQQAITIEPLEGYDGSDLGGAACQVDAFGGNPYAKITSAFTLTSPPLTLSDVTATKAEFYPLVKDGYLDKTEFIFSVNRKTTATLTITNPDGQTFYTRSIWVDRAGEHRVLWKGQTTSGKPIKPGRYRATITATADGVTLWQSTRVQVATKKVFRRQTILKDHYASNDSTGGNCRTDFDDEAVLLDCWGGAYARSVFTFKIPTNATNIRWGARTTYTSLDKNRGSLTKNGSRTSKTTFQVRVQVTGWRAGYVHGASVSYKARVQI